MVAAYTKVQQLQPFERCNVHFSFWGSCFSAIIGGAFVKVNKSVSVSVAQNEHRRHVPPEVLDQPDVVRDTTRRIIGHARRPPQNSPSEACR